ncbi:MAG: pyrroloquinoline quinone biosynthesis protein PqqB [Pseudomonadota bacterium]
MTGLRAVVLGAAAGGGLPQWNCGCDNCRAARAVRIPALTPSSLAATADGENWAILNASPDIGRQLLATPALHPTGPRETPIRAVVLTKGDIDHVAGLLTLREKQPFDLFMTGEIARALDANPIFEALDRDLVRRRVIPLDSPRRIAPGLTASLFAAPGKVPLYLENGEVETDLEGEQTVGVELAAGGKRLLHVPGCARLTPALADRLRGAAAVLFDGTLWSNDEMIRLGLGRKTGRRMGHMPISGPDGALAAFRGLDIARKVFVHINNSNPVLAPGSPERAEAEAAGWEIAQDGLEIAP